MHDVKELTVRLLREWMPLYHSIIAAVIAQSFECICSCEW